MSGNEGNLLPWRPGQSGSPHEPSGPQKGCRGSSAPQEAQFPVQSPGPPTQPARRVKPVQMSAFLHVAQHIGDQKDTIAKHEADDQNYLRQVFLLASFELWHQQFIST